MNKEPYHFEIKDIVTQFIAAFDDIVISRFNKNREVVDKLRVRYLYAPKERVLHDLVNKSQHITLPVVAVSIATISRDETRVFNKIIGSYDAKTLKESSNFIPSPVPIDIEINMSIITRFQTDMDQILSNFIPYSNPYIIISWKVPSDFVADTREIRSEVLWSGSTSLEYPTELQATDRARITADTSFTIKGWLFPDRGTTPAKNIFYVTTKITAVSGFEYI